MPNHRLPRDPDAPPSAHPRPGELEALFAGDLEHSRTRAVVLHLIAGCDVCGPICRGLHQQVDRDYAPEVSADDYDPVLDRAFAKVSLRKRAETELLAILISPPGIAPQRPKLSRELQIALIEGLIQAARSERGGHLPTYLKFAALAFSSAKELAKKKKPEPHLRDLIALARAERANAWRLSGFTQAAIGELELARKEAHRGTNDLRLIDQISSLAASVYTDARQFDRAESILLVLEEHHREAGEEAELGRVLMSLGNVASYQGRHAEAIERFLTAFDGLTAAGERELGALAYKNVLDCLVRDGLFAEAAGLMPTVREMVAEFVPETEMRKLRWLEASCAAGLGHPESAEAAFKNLVQEFGQAEMPFHQALVMLDLCGLWLSQGRHAEIREAARLLVISFLGLGISREAMESLRLLEQAAWQEKATAVLIRAAVREVEVLQAARPIPRR